MNDGAIIIEGRRIGYFRNTDVGSGFVVSFHDFEGLELLLKLHPNRKIAIGETKMRYGEFRDAFLPKVSSINMSDQYLNGRTNFEINAQAEQKSRNKPVLEDLPF